jgi:pimeloyl-ACP methyl ester carboxylesterase
MVAKGEMSDVQRLSVGEAEFVYRRYGAGPDILFIHGFISSGRMWEAIMDELAPHYRVWSLDLVGFGDSRHTDSSRILTVQDQAEFVAAFCAAVDLHPYAVIGHSMGGAITLNVALNCPELFKKMVLVAPVVTGQLAFNVHQFLNTRVGQLALTTSQHVWPYLLRLGSVGRLAPPPYLTREAMRRGVEDFQKTTWPAAYGGLKSMLTIGLDQRLHEIDKPTLIIAGSYDEVVPASDSRLAASLIQGAELLEIEDCHHHVPDENPDLFYRTIVGFLDSSR